MATGQLMDPLLRRANDRGEELLTHFGFREHPFGVTPNPVFLFSSTVHRMALQSMIGAIESNLGFTVLLGDPGMGKTTLLFQLLTLYRDSARTAFIFQTQCKRHDLLRHLASELELAPNKDDEVSLHQALKEMLVNEAIAGRKVLIILDEAQNLQASSLEAIRLLSDFETTRAKLLHIVLAGSARLSDTLASSELSQLAQRICTVCRLYPLSPEEVSTYVTFRLGVAGHVAADSVFSPEALVEVAKKSWGIPRVVNSICYGALSLAYLSGIRQVSRTLVQQAARNLDLSYPCAQGSDSPGNTESPRTGTQYVPTPWTGLNSSEESTAGLDAHRMRPEPAQTVSRQEIPFRVPRAVRNGGLVSVAASGPQNRFPAPANGLTQAKQMKVSSGRHTRHTSIPHFDIFKSNRSTVGIAALGVAALILWAGWFALHSRSAVPEHDSTSLKEMVPPPMNTQGGEPSAIPEAPQPNAQGIVAVGNGARPPKPDRVGTNGSHPRIPVVETLPQGRVPSRLPALTNNETEAEHPSYTAQLGVSKDLTLPLTPILPPMPAPGVRLQLTPETAASPATAPDTDSQIALGKPIKMVEPEYPRAAQLRHLQGDVVLQLQVDSKGNVRNVRSITGNPLLSEAAERAAWQWQYRPFNNNRVSTLAITSVRFTFNLEREAKK